MHELRMKIKDGTATDEDFEAFEGRICKRAVEDALRSIPAIIDYVVKQSVYLKKVSTKFYEDHPELLNHKEIVAQVLERAESRNPGVRLEQLLERIPHEVKEAVMEQKRAEKNAGNSGGRPDLKKAEANLGEI